MDDQDQPDVADVDGGSDDADSLSAGENDIEGEPGESWDASSMTPGEKREREID